jgi:sugar fermentation stimulation protein A|tara:strand:- start:940 stop:1644 length:705 start_codon:yes stop_codon:yes gene_type:complete
MNFENSLISGKLIKRYKRFFIDIKVGNKTVTAHCPNTGSMMGLLDKGNKVWITKSNNPKRKLKYTLQIIEISGNKVGVNTHLTNKIVGEALDNNLIKEFKNKLIVKSEVNYGKDTRFDFLVTENKKKSFIEVKNVTLSRKNGLAEFPDAITSRGLKHIKSLIDATKKGYKSYLLFVIQRERCDKFSIASDIDLQYAKLLTTALKQNVKILCFDCKFLSKGIKLNKKIKFLNYEQ